MVLGSYAALFDFFSPGGVLRLRRSCASYSSNVLCGDVGGAYG